MSRIQQICDEIVGEIGPLPTGFYVRPEYSALADGILIGNDDLAFFVSRRMIDDNLHLTCVKATWPKLLELVETVT